MDLTPEELRKIEGRWKSDVDKKLDRLVRIADKHEPFIEELIRREKARAQFWEDMARHAAKVGIGSLITSGIYAIWLGIKHAIRL